MDQRTVLLHGLDFRDEDYPLGSEAWCDAVIEHRKKLASRMALVLHRLFEPDMAQSCFYIAELNALVELVLRSNWRMRDVVRIKCVTPPNIFIPFEKENT